MSYFSLRANFAIKICLNKKKKNYVTNFPKLSFPVNRSQRDIGNNSRERESLLETPRQKEYADRTRGAKWSDIRSGDKVFL